MSATLEFLSAHEPGVVLPTIAFLIQQMKNGDAEEAMSLPPPPPPLSVPLTPQPPSKEGSPPSPDVPVSSSSGRNGAAAPRRLSADAMLEATSEPAAKAPTGTRMAIGGLPPPSPYAPLQRARQHHQRSHEDPNGAASNTNAGGYTRTVSGSSRQYDEDGTLSGTTTYVDRWFEKLFFRNPLVVGGVGAGVGAGAPVGGRPPSASRLDERLGKSSSHRSSSSAARRLRCELFAERAAGVLRNNSRPASGLASVNSSSASGMPPRDPSTMVTDYSQGVSKCAYGDALDDYAAVSPVRRVFQGNASRPSSGLPSSIAGGRSGKETRVRSRVDDAIAAAHRIRSGSARNSRPSSRCARTDDC